MQAASGSDPSQVDLNFAVRLQCRYCRDKVPNIVEDFSSGDMLCGNCGLVLGDRIIDSRSEWRTFADSEGDDPSRVGDVANPLLDGDQLDTVISRGGVGAASRSLNRTQDQSAGKAGDHTLLQGYKDISALCDSYDIPKTIVVITKQLYKKVFDEKLHRGKNNNAIVAVCILLACRQGDAPRTFKEICALTKVDRKELTRAYKFLKSKLGSNTTTTSSGDLIARFCSNLNLDQGVWRITKLVSEKANNMESILGKSPLSIASACIYLASHLVGDGRDAKTISRISGVGETTIKSTYRILYANRRELLTPDIMDRSPKAREANLADL
ncbi:transcription initiation factor IIB [Coemansia biformis]|uniref:Transcription initiation factor IIB n=1 Tax=Coemansia biformis TaxID=1286918 RepID=A0A9W8CXM9_9FUNG|nr:transcription initiation factor IIB [Coemansia biformis]